MVEKRLVCVWRVIYVQYVISLKGKRDRKKRKRRVISISCFSRYYVLHAQINFLNSAAKRGKRNRIALPGVAS